MSDIKLFRLTDGSVKELEPTTVTLEKKLQQMMEANLDAILGVRFLATEYHTGKAHGGRIDSLGLDENNCPVIIEYKRSTNENVINQGLFYLDWLLDHRGEFAMLVMDKLGSEAGAKVDWSSPRLVCIAGDFTRYDEHAVQQINRNIELLRYRWYEEGFLVLELVNAVTSTDDLSGMEVEATTVRPTQQYKTVSEFYDQASQDLRDLYDALEIQLLSLGDDVQKKITRSYYAFRRIKNFACVEVHPQIKKLVVFVKVNPDEVTLEAGFTRDVRNIGHFGTGDLEITLTGSADLERAKPLLMMSYETS